MKMEWFGFWVFMAVLVAADHWVFAQGYDTVLLGHKTPAEKELQRLIIEEKKLDIELKREALK